ncbi:MAG: hypothetical protein AB1941_18695 [Gemmatimonadota bacterium]
MRYGSDYGSGHWWGRAVRGDEGRGWMRGGVGRGHGFGGGDFDAYARRDESVVRGGFTGDAVRGYGRDYRGGERGWTDRLGRDRHRMDRDEARRGGHRFFGRWANEGEDDTWESDRHGVGRYAADPRMLERGGTGRGYSRDYDAGMRGGGRGAVGGGVFGWGRGSRGRYDRGW